MHTSRCSIRCSWSMLMQILNWLNVSLPVTSSVTVAQLLRISGSVVSLRCVCAVSFEYLKIWRSECVFSHRPYWDYHSKIFQLCVVKLRTINCLLAISSGKLRFDRLCLSSRKERPPPIKRFDLLTWQEFVLIPDLFIFFIPPFHTRKSNLVWFKLMGSMMYSCLILFLFEFPLYLLP